MEKLADNPVLAQMIAENINQHRLKVTDTSGAQQTCSTTAAESQSSGLSSDISSTPDVTSSLASTSRRSRTLTSTADLSINEDSLMNALEVSFSSVFIEAGHFSSFGLIWQVILKESALVRVWLVHDSC